MPEQQTKQNDEIIRLGAEKQSNGRMPGQDAEHTREVILRDQGGIAKQTGTTEETDSADMVKKAKEKLEMDLREEKKKDARKRSMANPEKLVTYLQGRCEEDFGFAEDVLKKGKALCECISYLVGRARKLLEGATAVAVDDLTVYEWAEDYYRAESTEKENMPAPGRIRGADEKTRRMKKTEKQKKTEAEEKRKKIETAKKSDGKEMEGQMSLFDFLQEA